MYNYTGVCFFCGSNSGRGSVSYLDTLYEPAKLKTAVLLKGGAGNGKSTLMKKLAAAAESRGMAAERIYCPSDPASLDGVLIPAAGCAIIDATPPHALEARFHCVPEVYLSLSEYLDREKLFARKGEIIELSGEIASCHAASRKRLSAALEAEAAVFGCIFPCVDLDRLRRRGAEAAARMHLQKAGAPSLPKKRFLRGLTPEGEVAFASTPEALLPAGARCFRLRDRFGLAPFFLAPVLSAALASGCETYAIYDPLEPTRLSGVIAPAAGVAYLTDCAPEGSACVNLDAAVSAEGLEENRSKNRVLLRAKKDLSADSHECLAEALRLHDRLEAIYREATDFKALDTLADRLISELLGR